MHGKQWLVTDVTEAYPEAVRRVPPIEDIEDPGLADAVGRLTANAPDYFWTAPSSTSHHPEPFRQKHGLWAHTLAVVQAVEDLWWTYETRGAVSEADKDVALAAAILHDQRKAGEPPVDDTSSVSDHDVQMAEVVYDTDDIPPEVGDAISTHMGASYDGPEPDFGTVGGLVHMADYAASRDRWRVRLDYNPPREVAPLFDQPAATQDDASGRGLPLSFPSLLKRGGRGGD